MAGAGIEGIPFYYREITEADYPGWMVAIMREIDRLLTDRGRAIFVLAEHLSDRFWSRYVHDTITTLLDDGWRPITPAFSP